ncbi:LysE family translocator [Paenibacillus sp. FSL W8-0194]|uniref:LysE family translocator n=1 Tax=Paenibacillus sp. FSL W8-0194 TaxID=2921711 RepID=UPI0030D90F1E
MVSLATLGAFAVIVLGLFVIPGPAVLLVGSRAVQGGRKAGMIAGLGIAAGDLVHTLFASIGLSAILMTSSIAFNAVKFAGAAYLLYLGVRAIMEKPSDPQLPQVAPQTSAKIFGQAVVIEVLNPKTSLFFLSFLPQFVHPEQGSTLIQFLILGLVFVMLSMIYTSTLAAGIQAIGRAVKRISWLGRWSGKIVGTIYIALGLKVAFQNK